MADPTLRGRFVWHELMTPDAAASRGFYAKALSWKLQPYEEDPSYVMFAAASGPLGGAAPDEGAPHWLPLIGTTDIEATLRQATDLGASVVKDISPAGGGHYAVLTDPQGATFGVCAHSASTQKETPAKRGEFSWHELATTDATSAFEFYAALFGWDKVREHDMGPDGAYIIFGRNQLELGGMYRKPESMEGPPAWLGYVRVKDVNAIVNKVKKSGGTLINGPMEVPGGDWVAQFVDPQGAMFAVHALKADMQPPAPETSPAAEPAQVDSLAETTVLTDIPAAEAKVRSASKSKRTASAEKRAPTKKSPAKKSPGKKAPAKKAPAKKGPSKKAAAKKAGAKSAAKKGAAKTGARKKPARKNAARKTAARKGGATRNTAGTRARKAARKGASTAKKKSARTSKKSAKRSSRPQQRGGGKKKARRGK